jgi:hypothetical protein
MKIIIESKQHELQRYDTVGDWFYDDDGTLHIVISNLSDERYIALVAIHELIEVLLCKHRHISQRSVDDFDMCFENERQAAIKLGVSEEKLNEIIASEPGDDSASPYHKEHCFATGIERLMASELDVKWKQYEKEVESL